MPHIAPYGTWTSPIRAADAAAAGAAPQWVDVVGNEVWWAQPRPAEGGRVALVRFRDGVADEVLPAPWNARNRVHEYGGRPWLVLGTRLVFTHWDDQRLYGRDLETGEITALTPEPSEPHGIRYGDLRPGADGEVWAVRERSTGPRPADVARDLVAVPLSGGPARSLAATHHFLTAPQLSPGGRHAAWLGWNHPAMPWDGTELCVATVHDDGTFGPHRVLAGGPDISVCQLDWESPDALIAVLDPGGWWNPHRVTLDGTVTNLAPVAEELGGPLWRIGSRWGVALGDGRHAVIASGRLAILDETTGEVTPVAAGLTEWAPALAPYADGVVGVAAGPAHHAAVVHVDLAEDTVTELTPPTRLPSAEYLPMPHERLVTGPDGQHVPAYVYPPVNPDHTAPSGERPPYLVHVHGGPTGRHYPVLDLDIAFFTSRGIGVVAVNYGGSTGYGRAYRERLRGQWGVVDVADCAAVAQALAADGTADPGRIAIRGGSAGGFTSAASMTTVRTYRAATIKYPVLDLRPWAGQDGQTHDFESRYLDSLVGPLPEAEARYTERSPINNVATLAGPVLLLQGRDDRICPPEQAERFATALDGSGTPHAYLAFDGEQHGFRKAETIMAALEAELAFYGQVFGFDTPGVAPLDLRR